MYSSLETKLKKEGRRNEYEMHKLLALNQRQKMVLQRKTEEASLATKRLKELLEAKKFSSREMFGSGNANGPGIQALMQTIEHELEVTLRVHEVRSEYERQLQERATMAKEVTKLKEESEIFKQKIMSDCPQTMSPSARNSRIVALENMLATSSSSLVFMASQLSEAEERERVFSGRGRWNQVRSLAEAKNLMNYLFNLASSSRCQLRDIEVNCREKDSVISELKEKVVKLNGSVRQLEAKLAERDLEMQKFASRKSVNGVGCLTKISSTVDDGYSIALHKAPRSSQLFSQGANDGEMFDDMDTSDSDPYEVIDDEDDEDWVKSGQRYAKRRSKSLASTEICCSCSKYSSCKTKKCECRAAGSICGISCGCVSSKCANREGDFIKKVSEGISPTELSEEGGSDSSFGSVDDVKNKELISQGTMLLQNALSERPTLVHQDNDQKVDHPRKPLSDIGNMATNPDAPKPPRRKNWRKSSLQLVPSVDPPLAASVQQNEAPRSLEDVPLRLPRAMDSTNLEHNPPFVERNSIRSDESVGTNKDNCDIAPLRPTVRLRKAANEKENHVA